MQSQAAIESVYGIVRHFDLAQPNPPRAQHATRNQEPGTRNSSTTPHSRAPLADSDHSSSCSGTNNNVRRATSTPAMLVIMVQGPHLLCQGSHTVSPRKNSKSLPRTW